MTNSKMPVKILSLVFALLLLSAAVVLPFLSGGNVVYAEEGDPWYRHHIRWYRADYYYFELDLYRQDTTPIVTSQALYSALSVIEEDQGYGLDNSGRYYPVWGRNDEALTDRDYFMGISTKYYSPGVFGLVFLIVSDDGEYVGSSGFENNSTYWTSYNQYFTDTVTVAPMYQEGLNNGENYELGYQAGYNTGYSIGYNKGASDGYRDGLAEGETIYAGSSGYTDDDMSEKYDEGWAVGYDSGYDTGYALANSTVITTSASYTAGYTDGSAAGLSGNDFVGTFGSIFGVVGQWLEIELFPGITLGLVLSIPLIFGIVMVVLKLVRG